MVESLPDKMLADIHRVYGAETDELFPLEIEESPYAELIRTLREQTHLTDDSDPNCDVCYSFSFEIGSDDWWLRLSQVGLYAMLLRLRPGEAAGEGTVAESESDGEGARLVLPMLKERGIRLLSRSLLEVPLGFDVDVLEEPPIVYRALFEDAEVLPWKA